MGETVGLVTQIHQGANVHHHASNKEPLTLQDTGTDLRGVKVDEIGQSFIGEEVESPCDFFLSLLLLFSPATGWGGKVHSLSSCC